MASRSRRSNAGNKMQKLIEQERQELRERTAALDDDEINLLFQEDEMDEEFTTDNKRKKEDDDVFSDSEDDSDADEDEEEGERELEQQERKKRKLAQKRKIPLVKQRPPKVEEATKPQYEQPKAESLLLDSRRTSKRSSVVANKLQVYEKLAQAEKKRAQIQDRLRKSRANLAYKELTQEDRLRQAEETEKINLLSLNQFREEEIYKKESRIASQLRKKAKFTVGEIMVRINTTEWMLTPLMEVEDRQYWEQQLAKRHKKKKKYTRRKKDKTGEVVSEAAKEGSGEATTAAESTQPQNKESQEGREAQSENDASGLVESHEGTDPEQLAKIKDIPDEAVIKTDENAAGSGEAVVKADEEKTEIPEVTIKAGEAPIESDGVEKASHVEKNTESTEDSRNDLSQDNSSMPPKGQESETGRLPKQVSFAADANITTFDSSEPSNLAAFKEISADSDTSRQTSEEPAGQEDDQEMEALDNYEGPAQLVGRNFVTLYSYPQETLKVHDMRPYLFGPQWAQPLNCRSENVETIARISNNNDENKWSDSSYSFIPDVSVLEKFPAFGEYDKKVSTEVTEETDTKLQLEIKTPAPTGVFLPNGVRKKCLITNRECQYFDPKNGVPYADVEAYKIVQELQDPIGVDGSEDDPHPQFKWFGFARGGIYLDVLQKPAKGVPEGF